MDYEGEFLKGLIELQYGGDVVEELKKLSKNVSWAKGWPEDNKVFWNAEAFMWNNKISKEKKEVIAGELNGSNGSKGLNGLGEERNLDLGCGADSYVRSVGFDFSEKMLQFNDNLFERVKGDLEQELPFDKDAFASVTAVFLFNYIKNYEQLLLGVKRVLKPGGVFMMVLFGGEVNEWQRQKEVSKLNFEEWRKCLKDVGFEVESYKKEGLWFFKCVNRKII